MNTVGHGHLSEMNHDKGNAQSNQRGIRNDQEELWDGSHIQRENKQIHVNHGAERECKLGEGWEHRPREVFPPFIFHTI